MCELDSYLGKREKLSSRSCNNHNIFSGRRNLVFLASEPLPQTSFYAIPQDRIPKSLLHDQSKAVTMQVVTSIANPKMGCSHTSPCFFHPLEVSGRSQSLMWPIAE